MLHLHVMMKPVLSTQKFFSTKIWFSVITMTEVIVVLETDADIIISMKYVPKTYAEKKNAEKDTQLYADTKMIVSSLKQKMCI